MFGSIYVQRMGMCASASACVCACVCVFVCWVSDHVRGFAMVETRHCVPLVLPRWVDAWCLLVISGSGVCWSWFLKRHGIERRKERRREATSEFIHSISSCGPCPSVSIQCLGFRVGLVFVHANQGIMVLGIVATSSPRAPSTGHHQKEQQNASHQRPHDARHNQVFVFLPPLDVGRTDKERGHHARVLVCQKVAVQDGFSGVVFVADPDAGPSVGRNGNGVPPDRGIEADHFLEDGVFFGRQFGTHLLDLKAVDVDVERVVVVIGVDQYVFDGLPGIGAEIEPVRRKRLSVDVVLRKGRHVAVAPHAKDDGFRPCNLFVSNGFLRCVPRPESHFRNRHGRELGVGDSLVDHAEGCQNLVVGMAVHVKELESLDSLLGNHIRTGFVELQQEFLALSARQDDHIALDGLGVGDAVAGHDVKGNRVLLPIVLGIIDCDVFAFAFRRRLVNNERVLVFDGSAEDPQVQDLPDAHVCKLRIDFPIDQKRMDLGQRRLSQQKLVDLDAVFGTWLAIGHVLKDGIPHHEIPRVQHVVGFSQFLRKAPHHVEQTHHAPPQLDGGRSVQMRVVPVQAVGMVLRQIEAVAVALARFYGHVGGVRIVRPDRIEHVDLDVQSVQVEIGHVKVLGHVGNVHLHEVRGGHRRFVVLVLDFLARRDEAGPVVVRGDVQWIEVLGGFPKQLVAELDPQGLAGLDGHGGSHVLAVGNAAGVWIGAGKGPPAVGVAAKTHPDGLDAGDQLVVGVAAVAGIVAVDEIGGPGNRIRGGSVGRNRADPQPEPQSGGGGGGSPGECEALHGGEQRMALRYGKVSQAKTIRYDTIRYDTSKAQASK
mmetsp:Transcript_4567/g.13146  ORF Transcript_4567/g.13146 Transcript_4567/m.13146 type:complete len:824 (+) Transcript_4567:246-2717(+)